MSIVGNTYGQTLSDTILMSKFVILRSDCRNATMQLFSAVVLCWVFYTIFRCDVVAIKVQMTSSRTAVRLGLCIELHRC